MIQNVEEIPKILILLKKIDYLGICRVFNYESNISFSEHKNADSKWLTVFEKNSKTWMIHYIYLFFCTLTFLLSLMMNLIHQFRNLKESLSYT